MQNGILYLDALAVFLETLSNLYSLSYVRHSSNKLTLLNVPYGRNWQRRWKFVYYRLQKITCF